MKVYLYEIRGDYVKCLEIYLRGQYVVEEIKEHDKIKTFMWIREKLTLLNRDPKQNEVVLEKFRTEIMSNVVYMADIGS